MKKPFTGSEMSESVYTGPGEICLAPTLFGDIVTVHVNANDTWNIGMDTFLACTPGVQKEAKSQGLSKALFSGEARLGPSLDEICNQTKSTSWITVILWPGTAIIG
ncbi:hypothetical protein VTN96DRAFT_3176 [Rasamsonia emersonii]